MNDTIATTPATDKLCPKCRNVQPVANFAGDKNRADLLARVCRSCDKVIQAEYRARKAAGALIQPRATTAEQAAKAQAAAEAKAAAKADKAAKHDALVKARAEQAAAKAQAKLVAQATPPKLHVVTDEEARAAHATLPQTVADVASDAGQAALEAAADAAATARRLAARDAKRRQRAAAALRNAQA